MITGLVSCFPSPYTDINESAVESLILLIGSNYSHLFFGLEGVVTEGYNSNVPVLMWPISTILEVLTTLTRLGSIVVRSVTNGLGGHLLLGFTSIFCIVFVEFSYSLGTQLVAFFSVGLFINVIIMEGIGVALQSFIWLVLSGYYSHEE